ncbi:MAG: hypothetical protein GXO25_01715, partial [Euryarchaeota archaeon]|nr:hypothetical protein [Euryarchaeota archaeon]
PVIAKNYIYVYGEGINSTNPYEDEGGFLRVYNLTTGKIVYQMIITNGGWENSLDIPDIAVSDGKVFIADGGFYVLVHGTTSEEQQNNMWYYAAAGAVVVIAVVVSVNIMKRNKK